MPKITHNDWVSAAEAAKILGIAEATLRIYMSRRQIILRRKKVYSPRVLYRLSDVRAVADVRQKAKGGAAHE